MKIKWFCLFLLFFAAVNAQAQTQTNVMATVVDPLGIPYANGTYSIQLIPTGTNPTVNGNSISGAFNGSTDATGSFNVALWPNASIVPAATKWQFTICTNPGGVAPPLGTGNQCTPPTVVTIVGSVQNLSTVLSNVAPALSKIPPTPAPPVTPPTANNLSWTRLGSVIGTPFAGGGSLATGEVSCFIQPSPQVLSVGYLQVIACLYTANSGTINYAEAPSPQGPFTAYAGNPVISNSGCASNVLSLGGQLVMFGCAARTDIHRYHSTTNGISWVDDGAVITHNGESWYSSSADNSSILVTGGVCYLWFDGTAGSDNYSQGLFTGDSTCSKLSMIEAAGDPQISFSELNGGAPFDFFDGTNFWQWELGGSTTVSAYPSYLYFAALNSNGKGTPSPHTHTQILLPRFADEGGSTASTNPTLTQVADPYLIEWPYAQGDSRNSTYMFYTACATECKSPQGSASTVNVAYIPLPMKTIVTLAQTDVAVQPAHSGWQFVTGISSETPLPDATVFDNAQRPDSPGMGPDWASIAGNQQAQIVNHKFEPPVAQAGRPLNLRVQPSTDQFSAIQLVAAAATSITGAIIRGSPIYPANFYACDTVNALGVSQTMVIRKFVNNVGFTNVATATVTPRSGDWIVFTGQGTSLTCTIYDPLGNVTISGTDSSLQTGLPGFSAVDSTPSNAQVANWSGGSIYGPGGQATQNTQIWTVPQIFQQAVLQPYLVGNLPAANSVKAGTAVVVTDASTFTVGTCTGGGSDTMLAVSNATVWTCH